MKRIFQAAYLAVIIFLTHSLVWITQASAPSPDTQANPAFDLPAHSVDLAESQEHLQSSAPEQPNIFYLPLLMVSPPAYAISGQIKDSQGNVLEGVNVTSSSGKTTLSDQQGIYAFAELAGNYVVSAAKAGYLILPANLLIAVPPASASHNLTATSNLYSVTGAVKDANGVPLAGITISTTAGHSTVSDSSGNYRLGNLPPGTYAYSASGSSHVFSPPGRTITVPPGISGKNFTSLTPVPIRLDMARFFHSQLTETNLPNACGPTSLLIVLDYFGVNAGNLDQVILASSLPPENGGFDPYCRENPVCLSAGVLASVAHDKYNLTVDAHDNWTFDQLYRSLAAGRPVIADIAWNLATGSIGHFVVVYGVDPVSQQVYYHDPYNGPDRTAAWSKFYTSWKGPVDVGDPLQSAGHRAWGMALSK